MAQGLQQNGTRPGVAGVGGEEAAGGNQADALIGIPDQVPHGLAGRLGSSQIGAAFTVGAVRECP